MNEVISSPEEALVNDALQTVLGFEIDGNILWALD